MMPWLTKHWLPIFQWTILAFLASLAFHASVTDHGVEMAVNCVCVGFLFSCMLMRPLIEARYKVLDAMLAEMNVAKAKFEQAVEEGRVEVVLLEAPRDGGAQHTVH